MGNSTHHPLSGTFRRLALMLLTLLPSAVLAQVYYYEADASGNLSTATATATATNATRTTWGASNATSYFYFDESVTFENRVEVNGTVYLILGDTASLNCQEGITVEEGDTLIITAGGTNDNFSGTGTLLATGSTGGNCINAGIGSISSQNAGVITINGGNVAAYCTKSKKIGYGAGIGGGYNAGMGTVTVNGGKVEAYCTDGGKDYAAGMGGAITINGDNAVVIAKGSKAMYGASITAAGKDFPAHCFYGDDANTTQQTSGKTLNLKESPNAENCKYAKVIFASTVRYYEGDNLVGKQLVAYGSTTTAYDYIPFNFHVFDGWYTDEALTNAFDFSTAITQDISLYAKTHESESAKSYYYMDADGNAVRFVDSDFRNIAMLSDTTTTLCNDLVYVADGTCNISNRPTVNGRAMLVLLDNCRLNCSSGITVEDGNTLIITAGNNSETIAETGTLLATGSTSGEGRNAGIGSTIHKNAGAITINGGNITAYSATSGNGYGAGIGGGYAKLDKSHAEGGMGGTVTINGGKVKAACSESGKHYATGIGRGYWAYNYGDSYVGTITINGDRAEVIAQGKDAAMYGSEIMAKGKNKLAVCYYGSSDSTTNTICAETLNLKVSPNLHKNGYAKVSFFAYNVNFYDGDSLVYTQQVRPDSTATTYDYPLSPLYLFEGWYTDKECTNAFDFSTPITSDISLYAKIDSLIYYLDADGNTSKFAESGFNEVELLTDTTSTLRNGVIYVADGTCKIDHRPSVSGKAMLLLYDGCDLNCTSGITVGEKDTLIITAGNKADTIAETGKLLATGSTSGDCNNAGIGSTIRKNAGTITINGGNVTAYCTKSNGTGYGAGIGGGYGKALQGGTWGGRCGDITINGGKVEAYCSESGKSETVGLGRGYYADRASRYKGCIAINGDRAEVIAKGDHAMYGKEITATGKNKMAICYYGSDNNTTDYLFDKTLNLTDTFNGKNKEYAKIRFVSSSIDITIGETGWATTYYGQYNLVVPEGVTARTYYVADKAIKVDHVYEAGDVIPVGTAVVLCDSVFKDSTYSFRITADKGEASTKSMLYGFDTDSTTVAPDGTTDGYVFYKFSLDDSGQNLGFYWNQENGKPFAIGAHKAYLYVPADEADERNQLLMSSVDGIESVNADAKNDNRLFDLNGRQRGTDTRSLPNGVYIRGGKKVVIK